MRMILTKTILMCLRFRVACGQEGRTANRRTASAFTRILFYVVGVDPAT